jgi:hypothetical protein
MLTNIGVPGLLMVAMLMSGAGPILLTGIATTQVVQPIPMTGPAPYLVAPFGGDDR